MVLHASARGERSREALRPRRRGVGAHPGASDGLRLRNAAPGGGRGG